MASRRLFIDNLPTFTASPYGLISVAVPQPGSDSPHWQHGVEWQSECGQTALTYDECLVVTGAGEDSAPAPSEKSGNVELEHRAAQPFTVYAKFDCTPVGMDDATQVAQDALARTETNQVESAFWTGLADSQPVVYPHLAANATVLDPYDTVLQTTASPVATGSVDVVTGLGLLEQALAECYGGTGVIHAPVAALPHLLDANLVRAQGGQLRTTFGNLVAAGAGYPGTGPDGTDPGDGSDWMYATSPVFFYRSLVRVRSSEKEATDRATNTVEMIAERTYVLGWECCHEAVQVNYGSGA